MFVAQIGCMTSLALKSVLYDWRRYLPVVIAVGVSGLMMVVQVALTMGAVTMAAAPIRQSSATLWVGPPDARTIDEARSLSPYAVSSLWLDPRIARIEPFAAPGYVSIGEDMASAQPAGLLTIDPSPEGLALARVIPPALRARLAEPGTVALDRADARKLKVGVGDMLTVNQRRLRVAGLLDGVRGLFGPQLVVAEITARSMGTGAGQTAFWLVGLRPGVDPKAVTQSLTAGTSRAEFRVWQPDALAASIMRVWGLESGAGTLFLASAGIALVITLMVVSQTLGAAVAGAVREYAALRAYGIAFRRVQGIVMRQGAWVCAAALLLTALGAAGVLALLKAQGVSFALPWQMALSVAGALATVVLISNLMAVRRLRKADPAMLLR